MTAPELQAQIRRLVEHWLEANAQSDLAAAVRISGALPIYSDMGGTLFLRPDGEILALDHASGCAEPRLETDPYWRITALAVGAATYPELRPFLPVRPAGAVVCEDCRGRGRIVVGQIKHPPVCGRCHGLGWCVHPL